MIPRLGSIRARLLAAAALWLTLALLAAWWVIGGLLAGFITDRFDAETAAIADSIIAGIEADEDGGLRLVAPPIDPRFSVPLSLWSWQLQDEGGQVIDKAPSLLDLYLHPPQAEFAGGPGTGPEGEPLRVLHRHFTLPGEDAPLSVTVTAPVAEITGAISRLRRPLALALAALGAGLAAATLAQVTLGLRSLDRLGRDIRAIRQGQAESLPQQPMAELRPVTAEINALLEANRSVIGRARDHLGNLAHSLRTPMAALANTLPPDHPGQDMIARMDRQIGWHLRRARSAGAPRLLGHWTPVAAVIDDILLVLRQPCRDRGLAVSIACPPDARFAGERQDLEEMLGNLLENAVKYAASRIAVTVEGKGPSLTLTVADDGPGLPQSGHSTALARGGRLDERGPPGAGLGLAIVADLAALHGGSLHLGVAAMGGLAARLTLPA
ncbi:ATP-binding protein [Paracoccus contaminans]|uniref:histidine kinase n=1 Tax=Paracoccus contaminans TaxID=1945662 RepID=A0A1W6D0A5_9RHOB|nr:ATP-binding protein [Paracoccus contaminans]ARJ70469.1 histidine kinase [Paracoccus contaminans]